MDTAMVRKRAYGRKPLAALGTLTVMALIGIAGALVYVQAIIMGDFNGELVVFLALSLLIAGLVAGYPVGGWRWTPLLGAFWSSLESVMHFGGRMVRCCHESKRLSQ